MIRIEKAGQGDIPLIRELAQKIWSIVYTPLLQQKQIEYMLNLMYSEAALQEQMKNQQHEFILVIEDEIPLGYASFSKKSPAEPGVYRLHKLYVMPNQHGKGLGRQLLTYISSEIVPAGATALELNVYKKNPAIGFYEKMGFRKEREVMLDIGQGYYMDDYIMTLHYQ